MGARALAGYDDVARDVSALGVGFIRTRGFVCFERSCPTVIGHTIAWADSNHLSAAYSGQVAARSAPDCFPRLARVADSDKFVLLCLLVRTGPRLKGAQRREAVGDARGPPVREAREVPGAGLEPARPREGTPDFKSPLLTRRSRWV